VTPELLTVVGINPALSLLPPVMNSRAARAMLFAIALQESGLEHRKQRPKGPGRSYFQFEAGIRGVLTHHASSVYAHGVCISLDVAPTYDGVHEAIGFNDPLACAFARLLLWTLPQSLPTITQADAGWLQYLSAWNPGEPRPSTWPENFTTAWSVV